MNNITKSSIGRRSVRVHVALRHNRTLCGIVLNPAQEVISECDCKRCKRCLRAANRIHIRGTARLNGRRVSPNQLAIPIK